MYENGGVEESKIRELDLGLDHGGGGGGGGRGGGKGGKGKEEGGKRWLLVGFSEGLDSIRWMGWERKGLGLVADSRRMGGDDWGEGALFC